MTASGAYVQAHSAIAAPSTAPKVRKVRLRSEVRALVIVYPRCAVAGASIDDETKIALVACDRIDVGGDAINPVDAGEQRRLRIGSRREAIIGSRQLLLRDGPNDIGRHQNHELGFVVDVVLTAEE